LVFPTSTARACRSSNVLSGLFAQTIHNRTCLASSLKSITWPLIRPIASSYTRLYASSPLDRLSKASSTLSNVVFVTIELKWSCAKRNLGEFSFIIYSNHPMNIHSIHYFCDLRNDFFTKVLEQLSV